MKRTPNKSQQNRPKTRAVHGSPDFTARIGAWVTEEQYQYFHCLLYTSDAADDAPRV